MFVFGICVGLHRLFCVGLYMHCDGTDYSMSHGRQDSDLLYCALSLVAQCIVISPVCGFVCLFVGMLVCLCVCYHDNSKLRASILSKLGLYR